MVGDDDNEVKENTLLVKQNVSILWSTNVDKMYVL
jgi:hypothetical protein